MLATAHSPPVCQAWAEGGGAEAAAVRALLTRALSRALKAPRGLCRHPAAAGAVFRLLGLALRCARHGLVRGGLGLRPYYLFPTLRRHCLRPHA